MEQGLSPTRWHCVHTSQVEGLLLVFLPPKMIFPSRSGRPCFPPSLLGAAGWGMPRDLYHQPVPEPSPQPRTLPLLEKKKKN